MAKKLISHKEKARQLIVSAALDMTRYKRKVKRACKLVLLYNHTQAEAAEKVGLRKQNVSRALVNLKPKLAEVEAYVGAK